MTIPQQRLSRFRLSEKNTEKNYLVREIFPLLVEKGEYQDLWQSPGFQQAYQLSAYLQQSANLLKKHLPPRYHEMIRFTQNPDTWVLGVADEKTVKQLSAVLKEHYGTIMRDELGLPQHVKLRRLYRNWEDYGQYLSAIDFRHADHVERLRAVIPVSLHQRIRLRYEPSVWQMKVQTSALATQLNLLLDELSFRLAKDMKFAPKLNVSVVPDDWKSSGFSLTELVKEKRVLPNEAEAEAFLENFLKN